ncbi:hypothetical protein T02_7784 [Trichinella nativa]|uniref:Uncharacterized protein n=2 Tax=Trichinella TaxID=6333 RepID=A0A0V1LMM1_9BILA|nr:hypothetical protein T05_14800 [Trichinella murrelli]KRZ60604.1 hypothetical protein T02_7784 [Trichinella nativa]
MKICSSCIGMIKQAAVPYRFQRAPLDLVGALRRLAAMPRLPAVVPLLPPETKNRISTKYPVKPEHHHHHYLCAFSFRWS